MKTRNLIVSIGLLLGMIALAAPQGAMAANNYTPACTQINNTAHVNYKVGGVDQGPGGLGLDSTTASFLVGVKVDVLVTTANVANVTVYPGSVATALTYTVTNNGNAHQQYVLSSVAEPNTNTIPSPFGGGNDVYDATAVTVSSAGNIADLAPDASQEITITANTPLAQTDQQIAVYALKAQTRWVGGGSDVNASGSVSDATIGAACTALSGGGQNIDVVIGDGAGSDDVVKDGAYSARSAYQVTAANLTITKSSTVISDPVNGAVAKAIPGAVIEYTIQIHNAATGTATNVTVTDTLDTNLAFSVNGYAALAGIQVTAPNLYGGVATALTNASDADQGDYNITSAGAVTVSGISVGNGQDAYVKFRATIK